MQGGVARGGKDAEAPSFMFGYSISRLVAAERDDWIDPSGSAGGEPACRVKWTVAETPPAVFLHRYRLAQ